MLLRTWTGCWRVHGPGLTAPSSALRVTAHPAMTGLASWGPVPQRYWTSQCCQKTRGPHVKKSAEMQLNHFLFCGILSFSDCSRVSCRRYSCCDVSESTQHCFGRRQHDSEVCQNEELQKPTQTSVWINIKSARFLIDDEAIWQHIWMQEVKNMLYLFFGAWSL